MSHYSSSASSNDWFFNGSSDGRLAQHIPPFEAKAPNEPNAFNAARSTPRLTAVTQQIFHPGEPLNTSLPAMKGRDSMLSSLPVICRDVHPMTDPISLSLSLRGCRLE